MCSFGPCIIQPCAPLLLWLEKNACLGISLRITGIFQIQEICLCKNHCSIFLTTFPFIVWPAFYFALLNVEWHLTGAVIIASENWFHALPRERPAQSSRRGYFSSMRLKCDTKQKRVSEGSRQTNRGSTNDFLMVSTKSLLHKSGSEKFRNFSLFYCDMDG